jgi:hypothetical protein
MSTNVMSSPDFTAFDEAVNEFKLKATGNAGK